MDTSQNDTDLTLLAFKRQTLRNYRDIAAVLETQISALGSSYTPPDKVLAFERIKGDIAAVSEEIAKLEMAIEENGGIGAMPPSNTERVSYTAVLQDVQSSLLDVQASQARVAAGQLVAEGKIDSILIQVSRNTRRLDSIEGFLKASDAVRDAVRFTSGSSGGS